APAGLVAGLALPAPPYAGREPMVLAQRRAAPGGRFAWPFSTGTAEEPAPAEAPPVEPDVPGAAPPEPVASGEELAPAPAPEAVPAVPAVPALVTPAGLTAQGPPALAPRPVQAVASAVPPVSLTVSRLPE